ncbi:GntR family transcriptional regulator [Amycolatopsis minnesotensis]|uniref:HTH gntR-type domain-containing protein n=1 Tax=Amycolatopsis minnesotensis TaxID=337894 RepID=A0ABN2SYX5_9PSEU
MSEGTPDSNDTTQLYVHIAAKIRDAILRGDYTEGDQLPAVRDLVTEYGVSDRVIQRAFKILREQGFITTWPKKRSIVRALPPNPEPDPAATDPTGRTEILATLDHLLRRTSDYDQLVERITTLERDVATLRAELHHHHRSPADDDHSDSTEQ